jgi:L-arabinonolactonase
MEVRRIGTTTDLLGESCVWSTSEQALYWVDIRQPALRRLNYSDGRVDTFEMPELVGAVCLREGGGVMVAMQDSIAHFDPATSSLERVARALDTFPNIRFNDSRVDPQGRFWAGTMDDVARGEVGTLYRLDSGHRMTAVLHPIIISNSLAFSPDSRTMYFSDTVSREIWAYDFDSVSGIPSNRRVFANVPAPGTPDGSTVDAEGYLWNAEWDGARMVRYAPDGRVDRIIPMPVRHPTCCTFGGPDLTTLFVTTASLRLSDVERAAQPMAGGLLALEVGIKGVADPAFRP